MALSNAAAKDIEPELGELIKIRASQINHCAFCLDMHTARRAQARRQRVRSSTYSPPGKRPAACSPSASGRRWR